MAPGVFLDLSSDFDPTNSTNSTTTPPSNNGAQPRTLLLAPPSIASHEERISALFSIFSRATTDLHMLDRLAAGLVTLPPATYDLILVLTDADGSRRAETSTLLSGRDVWARLAPALKAGGKLRSEDGSLGTGGAPEAREAVLAGLVSGADGNGFTKPDYAEEEAVPLRFGLKKKAAAALAAAPTTAPAVAVAAPPSAPAVAAPAPVAGVGFIDFSDDLDLDGSDDDYGDEALIDEDALLGDDELNRPIPQPLECQPKPGNKRRACKDCSCGLAQRLEAEDKARREKADSALETFKLKSEDLMELDLTVQGKTGSCGSCALGDAFRCADCPYIGLPPFKPGEEVTLLNNDAQF
ncbi:cytokine-induced anti-apoptosis inhibitor 1, Fe-S biogenesis-domain-containing protein [Bombardia bombarda]|uniref:Cytokine-induced anti-apoptosis inhibitor 1, Fe-S biogenesis-domain-containing protein n=1 Tax=Bombardia bombarda TaxID=252184 RepID=A0AA40CF26_9PEZI|nr:cytokine-induced anti-apoptosis inhibitor 1, Fe-S biogenesis-domain-containing protein [Bombardia bombarda]